ncbi:hypothetical protein H6G00_00320 [Leptolyngbya sp. FACHB-541]|uniref:hypothetical protein n=1 Tax=Leptolyngbya sp. FACHB-541 TaxID=2692810 RepID=UPI00168813D7|nr:hypothetical protein [Leptolyngbya sp. FACHB-541]MBD1995073.1 hypothetical protein [Leptolyngbya sp. FACHB-541]
MTEETTAIQQTENLSQFAQLLQSGRILDALEYRSEILEEIAADERNNCTAAKLMSIGAIAGSIPLLAVAVPGVPLVAGLAGFLYAKTVWDDWQNSKKLCLFPGSRAGLGDLMAVFGMAAEKMEGSEADHEDEIIDFLNLQQACEYRLLGHFEPQLADLLQKLPPQDRVSGYRYILRRAGKQGTIPSIQDVRAAIAAEPSDSVPPTQLQPPGAALPAVEADKEGDLEEIPARGRPAVNLALNPEINVHNHLGRYGSAAPKTASPAQAYRQTEAPDLTIYPDVRERMKSLLKAMAQSGCPLGTLLNQPFCWFWGNSQSGKTTLATLLAIARMGMGHEIGYFSTDSDVAPLHWARMEDSPEGYSFALDDVARRISKAPKGSLKGEGWVFDEMFAAYGTYELELNPLLNAALMKLAKTCGTLIGISQVDTSGAHGLKNIDASWRSERVSIQAIHEEDELGDRSPTGRYIVTRGDESFEWSIPEWMLTELNEWGHPDPVVWLLNWFPELCKGQICTQSAQHLEAVVARLDEPEHSADGFSFNASGTDLETLEKLFNDVIDEPEPITQTATRTDEQTLIAWFKEHPSQAWTKRELIQRRVKLSESGGLDDLLIKLTKDGWLEMEETPQTKKFKWIPDELASNN